MPFSVEVASVAAHLSAQKVIGEKIDRNIYYAYDDCDWPMVQLSPCGNKAKM